MRVQDIANQVGVTAHTIRYYNKLGLLSSNRDPSNQYRRFDASALERLRFVLRAKTLGFSLAEIREVLEMSHAGRSPCPRVRDIVRERIAENAASIAQLNILQRRLEQTARRWSEMTDQAPNGPAICHLIESLGSEEG
jgi:DNA-binding transcriptional MerR regulator